MLKRLNSLIDAGLGADLRTEQAKRLAITHRMALIFVAVTLPYVIYLAVEGFPWLSLLAFGLAIGFLLVPLGIRAGYDVASRVGFLALSNCGTLVFSLELGKESAIHLSFFTLMCLPLVIFEPRQRAWIGISTIIPVTLLGALVVFDFFGFQPVALSAIDLDVLPLSFVVCVAFTMFAALALLHSANLHTETQLAETVTRLRSEKEKLDSIFTGVNDIVFLMDKNQRYVAVNDRVARYGASAAQMIGKTNFEIMSPEDARDYDQFHRRVLDSGEPLFFVRPHKSVTGDDRWFHISLTPVRDHDGLVSGLVGVSRDVTADRQLADELRRAKDAADAANETKTYFLANMSHELRTPITAILGFAELLADPKTPDTVRQTATRTILRNGEHLNALIGDILDLTMIEAGKMHIHSSSTTIREAIEATLQPLAEAARRKGLAFDVRVDDRVPLAMMSDQERLRQVLVNVVGNAVKFTTEGRIGVDVQAAGGTLEIKVADTGCGIDPENAKRLFEPFTQADVSTTRRYGGTGLGLALSRSLARALGGDLVLRESALGVGCTFVLALPLIPGGMDMVAARAAARIRRDGQRLIGSRVLVVDDTEDIRAFLCEALSGEGAEVDTASDGIEALVTASKGKYDLVFMDIQLPRLDGYTVTRQLRERNVATPIIALTGRALLGEREACRIAGCDDYLTKPVSLSTLIDVTANWIKKGHERAVST